jgi:hypothetical protein
MPITAVIGIVVAVGGAVGGAVQQSKNRKAMQGAATRELLEQKASGGKQIKTAKAISRGDDISKIMADVAKGYTVSTITKEQQEQYNKIRQQTQIIIIGSLVIGFISVAYFIHKKKNKSHGSK